MNEQSFFLLPFPADSPPPATKISGNIARNSNTLAITYVLQGALAEIEIPERADAAMRKCNLWEATCFEFFLGVKGLDQYWEFNLSPAGHWNVYRFASYRQGMQEETVFMSLPFSVQHDQDFLRLALEIDLASIIHAGQALEIGVSAVIKFMDGGVKYWALGHPGTVPDFHRRDTVIVQL
jgi:hypothetical protein